MSDALRFFDKEADRIWALIDANPQHLHARIRDDDYTVWDVLAHIVIASQGVITFGMNQLQPSNSAPISQDGFNLDEWNHHQMLAWRDRSLDDLKAIWVTVRPLFEQFLAIEQQDAILNHPMGMQLSYGEYVNIITYHLRMHRQEIEEGLALIKDRL